MVDFTYINAALTVIGQEPIGDYDNSVGGKIAAANYENAVVRPELARYPWRFATKTETLGPPITGAAPEPWLYARTLPFPVIRIRTVKSAGLPIKYEVQFDKLLTDYDESNTLAVHALWRPDEAYWLPAFGELISLRMQQLFLRGIGERYGEADAMKPEIKEARSAARLADAQMQPPINPWRSPTLEARVA